MKKLILFALLLTSASAFAQYPYFQKDVSSTTSTVSYVSPVDIQFDGVNKVYSYHAANIGTVVVKYASGNGAITDAVLLSRSGMGMTPVRVRTQGSNYYALFNTIVSGVSRYCLIKINTTTNVCSFTRQIYNATNTLDLSATDFILDGVSNAYILSNYNDAVNGQSDLCVTKVDISTATPTILWNNIYQNVSRDDFASNIVIQQNHLFASYQSIDPANSIYDRGIGVIKLDLSGNYVNSKLYQYSSTCISARSAGTWLMVNGDKLVLSCITYVGADGNGPFWLAYIDPTGLGMTTQKHYSSGAVYFNPEIQLVSTAAGSRILMSGSASMANVTTPGYVHHYFDGGTLDYVQGTKYPTTTSTVWSGGIYDTYINTGTGKNVFSIAEVEGTNDHYYLLKTSDLGDHGCDIIAPALIPQSCTVVQSNLPTTTVAAPALFSLIKLFTVTPITNAAVQSCYVCPNCPPDEQNLQAPGQTASEKVSFINAELSDLQIYPNPTNGLFTLTATDGVVNEIEVYTLAGARLLIPVRMNGSSVEIDLTDEVEGIYLVKAMVNGQQRNVRVIKQ